MNQSLPEKHNVTSNLNEKQQEKKPELSTNVQTGYCK